MSERETALVVGAGPGLGWALANCFAGAGMQVAAAAREPDKLSHLAREHGVADRIQAYRCDVSQPGDVSRLFEQVEQAHGTPTLVVFNAGTFEPGSILEIDPADLERCWRVSCLGGLHVGQEAARRMLAANGGSILFTGATASLRGGAKFANLAVPKFGLRALAQSMARELGPQGIHVAHVVIDGQIESDSNRQLLDQRGPDSLLASEAIAEAYLQLHRQPRSAWTHELDLRPWVEKF